MAERMVRCGPIEVLLHDLFFGEVVERSEPFDVLTAELAGGTFSVRYTAGRLDLREPFLRSMVETMRPRRSERMKLVLGGCTFDAMRLSDPEAFGPPRGGSYTAGVADFFGDFLSVGWGFATAYPQEAHLQMLYDTMVQGMIVRRQRTLPRDVLHTWVTRRT